MKSKLILAALSVITFATLAGFAGKDAPPATPARATLVRAVPVTYSDAAVPVRAVGVLSRKAESELSFKLGGLVADVAVRAGDKVVSGQVLARLQADEFDARVDQAVSALAKARRDLARLETLQADRVATLENLQDARTAAEVAGAALRIAEFNRKHTVIVAPDDGWILRRRGEPGELVAAGQSIVSFASDAEGWLLRAGVADRDLARVRVGDRVEVIAGEAPMVAGRLTHIAEAADPLTRTTPVEIGLEAVPVQARSGRVAVAMVQPQSVAARPVVPATALIEGAGATASLFLVEAGSVTARRVAVEVETLHGDQAFLRTPLSPTAQVVVTGGEYLRDGMTVEIGR